MRKILRWSLPVLFMLLLVPPQGLAEMPQKDLLAVAGRLDIDLHEYPWIGPVCTDLLRTGMILAIEPKIWRTGEYYLRVEDIVLIGPDGAEFLTEFDRDQFQL